MKQVIEILSDSEEKEAFKSKEMKILQKQIEDEASMCNSNTSLLLAVNKQFIEGTPNEKQKVLVERIKKMFIDTCQFNLSTDHFCMKRQPNYNRQNCQIIHNQLIIFGTDFWPTRKIKSDALAININLETFKIDDSHTKLKFTDFNDAKRWLQFYGKNNKKMIEKIEEQQNEQMMEQKKQENKLKGWFPLESYYYQEIQRILQGRFCTSYQLNVQELIQDVKTTSYMKFKQKMEEEMLKEESAKISYELAEERRKKQRKYRRNQQFSSFHQRNDQKRGERTRNRTPNMNINKSRDYEDRSRNKRKYKDSTFNHDYNRKKSHSPIGYPNQTIGAIRQNSVGQNQHARNNTILGQLQEDSGNYSFLLESHNENEKMDMSIALAISQMKIEDNQDFANMSIQIRPKDDIQNNQNMSIVLDSDKNSEPIDMSIQSFLNKPNDKQEKRKESDAQQKKEKEKEKKVEQKQGLEKKTKKNSQSMNASFDYLRYIEQSEKLEKLGRQKPIHE